ncbi:cullin family domain-containing protein [Ditylenchus destructor]|uniref:Cullin-5 n=1 Tax=Ditylenchus destructor TaxID=166010 RepID=A0AAD4NA33_9BILA|nr:cullin family domain-containing protein [Ditylenchus destructor]
MASLLKQHENNNIKFETEWQKGLRVVLNLLNRKNVSKGEWHDLFTINSQITSWVTDGGDLLLIELKKEIQKHVENADRNIHINTDENSLLTAYITEWQSFAELSTILPLPFKFIEQNSAKPKYSASKELVRNLMLECWSRVVFDKIAERLLHASMKLIEKERNGEPVESKLIVGVRESFVDLCVECADPLEKYTKHFEKSYLEATEVFYKSRTAQLLNDNGILAYMAYADEKLAEEEHRAKLYLDSSVEESAVKLIEKCVDVLVIEYQDQFLAEAPALIKASETDRLKMMYRLINRTPNGITTLLNILAKYIKAEGLDAMKANAEAILADCEKFVDQLLNMYVVFSQLVKEAFFNDPRFLTVRDQAFQEVVNNTDVFRLEMNSVPNKNKGVKPISESKCPELLANYCDLLLRKTALTKKFTSEEIDEKLNNVLLVLKYVTNKDVFMRYHKTHLSRRLILELVADQEKEESLVNKFREAGMPADYVNKLFRMLQDIEVNKDLNSSFKKSIGSNNNYRNISDAIAIKILNGGAWSRGRDRSHLSLPHELDEFIPEVEDFYRKQHSGRKLNWAHHWSTGTITFSNNVGKYDLEVTTFQISVLFAWNDRPHDKLSFNDLRLSTDLSDAELTRTLLSLVSFPKTKYQVLLTDSPIPLTSRTFSPSTLFWINQEFAVVKNDRPQPRGKLNLVGRLQLNQDPGTEEEHSEILQLRVFRIQEAIVKILKMRKQITQAQLQTELVEVLKHMFLPSKKLIKEQIEWLIEHHYMKRHNDDINTFIYVS